MERIYNKYAVYYDIIHSEKNYLEECAFVESIFRIYCKQTPKSLLDIGCGTGSHALIFAKNGHDVTGVDLSTEMINYARQKAEKSGYNLSFKTMNMTDLKFDKKFDACTIMFGAIGYLESYEELKKTFLGVKRHLGDDGILLFDYWNGPAVLSIRPTTVNKDIKHADTRILRLATPQLNVLENACSISYHCIVLQNKSIIDEFTEVHNLRYYFPREIHFVLEECGFKVLKTMPFLKINASVDDKSWNLTTIAKLKNS